MSSPVGPRYFCTRPNGAFTPLIAVDELPSHVSIRGVPRNLQPDQTRGMTSLGTVAPRTQAYWVENLNNAGPSASSTRAPFTNAAAHRAPDPDQQATLAWLLSSDTVPESIRLAVSTLQEFGLLHHLFPGDLSGGNWVVPSGGGGGARQGPHHNSKKEYCSYWLRHGECDYQQQGKSASCLYKHEMPRDQPTLERLGLREIPRWWREKHGMVLPNGHSHARFHHARAALPPADSNSFATIQYPSQPEINGVLGAHDIEPESKRTLSSPYAVQQSSLALPGPSRPAYESRKASDSQKHGAKHGSSLKKLDLLSFDPLPDFAEYSSVGSASRNMCAIAYPETSDFANPDVNHEFLRSVQSLMPPPVAESPDYLMASSPFQSSQSQTRPRKAQRSRRLYQARPDAGLEVSNPDAFGGVYRGYGTGPSSMTSPTSRVAPGSHLASPVIGSVLGNTSEPPTRDPSPSIHSGPVSADSSPGVRPSFGAIGAKRVLRQKSIASSEDELFSMNTKDGR
ncbi:hypothetical protein BO78DRAFT_434599 [Aspergillus sclerotiicarbonarius CBS 121057]|uniref:C3H1-type domain-containing protein n=1 Tax=Aspergillus sclerotiicarbonarius (strain CBS 121057 / IBT 28362) TaxID=1448318 RepID=A0A319ERH6_ASPSB|nr:hypothetical protein BO78DRAFT_434599 [Aspergillus sclerotiicarbonarius CBS 121057]